MSDRRSMRHCAARPGAWSLLVCAAAIAAVGLDPELKRRVGQYSQGMRQRMSLARAVLHDPRLVLLDEPFSNVDIVSAREMVRLLGEMRDAGKTVFVVTHQPSLLEGVADESVWMSAGRIEGREAGVAAMSHPVPPGGTRVGHPGQEGGTRVGHPGQEGATKVGHPTEVTR